MRRVVQQEKLVLLNMDDQFVAIRIQESLHLVACNGLQWRRLSLPDNVFLGLGSIIQPKRL